MTPELEARCAAARAGDRRALARLISLVEDEAPAAAALNDWALAAGGGGYRIGVTGPPGAGKSSLLDGLLRRYRAQGLKLAALAVDPSSAFTGGALLGDRIRMHEAARDPEIFIRSLGSRGSLGGLARQTEAVADLLDACGAERIFIETLGVGQSELDIVENCFTTVVVLTPESGDGIQTMKAGLMEIGDLFVINKADREGAPALAMELEASLMRRGEPWTGWRPPVLQCVATQDRGLDELVAAIEQHCDFLTREGRLDAAPARAARPPPARGRGGARERGALDGRARARARDGGRARHGGPHRLRGAGGGADAGRPRGARCAARRAALSAATGAGHAASSDPLAAATAPAGVPCPRSLPARSTLSSRGSIAPGGLSRAFCIGWCASIWRPSWTWRGGPTPRSIRFPPSSSAAFARSSSAASWRTASPVFAAAAAGTTFSWPSPAERGVSARAATRAGWSRPRRP